MDLAGIVTVQLVVALIAGALGALLWFFGAFPGAPSYCDDYVPVDVVDATVKPPADPVEPVHRVCANRIALLRREILGPIAAATDAAAVDEKSATSLPPEPSSSGRGVGWVHADTRLRSGKGASRTRRDAEAKCARLAGDRLLDDIDADGIERALTANVECLRGRESIVLAGDLRHRIGRAVRRKLGAETPHLVYLKSVSAAAFPVATSRE